MAGRSVGSLALSTLVMLIILIVSQCVALPMKKDRAGIAFQRLIAAIEHSVANDPNINVESPKFLRDKDTGKRREHDVVITINHKHHTALIAIECRDRKRQVGVPDVEGFYQKCLRTGVHQAVIVSQSGFRGTALQKAQSYSIKCMQLDTAQQFDWCAISAVTEHNRPILKAWLQVEPILDGAKLYLKPRTLVTPQVVKELASQALSASLGDSSNWIPGEYTRAFQCQLLDHFFFESADGTETAVSRLELGATYKVEQSSTPMSFQEYKNPIDGELAASVASAPITMGDRSGRLFFVKDTSGEIQVSLQMNDRDKPIKPS